MYGDTGHDVIRGGIGDDQIIGDYGVIGEEGNDNDQLFGDEGNDGLWGGQGDDIVYGGIGNDSVSGNTGNDQLFGDDGDDMLYGGEGDDYVSGGQGNDVLTDNPDRGAPTNSGNDMFFGGEGRDVLSTGVGDDYLNGGAGADTLDGGEGFDTAGYHAASGAVTVDLLAPGQNTGEAAGDVYVGIEAFQLSGYDDAFIGTNAAETVYGDSGNDTIRGGGGDDRLIADRSGFHSSSGADVLFGEGGNDYLEGGRGADALSGGAGADLFVYRSTLDSVLGTSDSVDVISDFSRGEDRVDLSLVDANGALAGDQAFTFLTNPGGYNGDWSGLVWAKSKGGITTIYASTDADSSPEMQITLTGNHHLTASDFIL